MKQTPSGQNIIGNMTQSMIQKLIVGSVGDDVENNTIDRMIVKGLLKHARPHSQSAVNRYATGYVDANDPVDFLITSVRYWVHDYTKAFMHGNKHPTKFISYSMAANNPIFADLVEKSTFFTSQSAEATQDRDDLIKAINALPENEKVKYASLGDALGVPPLMAQAGIVFVNPTGGKIRIHDKWGKGHYGASRKNGKKQRRHKGSDFIAIPNQDIVSVISGEVTKIGYPYASDLSFRYIEIYDGQMYRVRIFYVEPKVGLKVGANIKAGDMIGRYQSLVKRYPKITDHVHVEIRKHGTYVNPENLIP